MDEQEVLSQTEEVIQDQDDAFMDGWDDAPDTREPEAQPETQDQEPPQEAPSEAGGEEHMPEQAPSEAPDDVEAGDKAQAQTESQPQVQTWEVNILGERKTMRTQDITPELLQKGLDYDRIHQQYDRTKPVMTLISTLAQRTGVSVDDYIRMVRTEAKMAGGLGEEEAKRAVELEDREAAVSEQEAAQREDAQRREAAQTEVQRGVEEFAKAFPEVYDQARRDPKAIPDSVWEAVRGGLPLTAAYAQYAVAQANAQAKAAQDAANVAQLNQRNTQRSTGSMHSAGGDTKAKDPFLEGWDE